MDKKEFCDRIRQKPLVVVIDNGRGLVSVMFFYIHMQHRLAGMATYEFEHQELISEKHCMIIYKGITADALWDELKNMLWKKTRLQNIQVSFSMHINTITIFAEDEQPWTVTSEISANQKKLVKTSKALLSSHTKSWAKATAQAFNQF